MVAPVGRPVAVPAEHQDHAVPLLLHVPRRRPRGQKSRPQTRFDRGKIVGHRHIGGGLPLYVVVGDDVDRDLDPTGPTGNLVGVRVDRFLVPRVHDRGLDRALNLRRHPVEALLGTPGQENVRTLLRERLRHRTADRAATAVDDRVPPLQQHQSSSSLFAVVTAEPA
jgi:hypothetical protein